MLPCPKRKRSVSPDISQTPTSLLQLERYFTDHSLDMAAPCTVTPGSATASTAGTPEKRCWVVENLVLWNGLLHPVGLQLREDVTGRMTLQTFFVKSSPNIAQYREISAFLVKRLMNDHHCVHRVCLSYAGEIFGYNSRLLSELRPSSGVQKITLDGRLMSMPEHRLLVRVMLRGDPLQMEFRNAWSGVIKMSSLITRIGAMTRLTDINLSRIKLDCRNSVRLLEAIEACGRIKCLNLDFNMISVMGAQRLAQFLMTNKTLLKASLFKTRILDSGAVAIAKALAANPTLESLMIGANSIGPTGAREIASSLRVNTSLICLDLRRNKVGNEGAISIAQALGSNETLRELHLGCNAIGDQGIAAIADSLASNRTLHELSIPMNECVQHGVAALARLVATNKTLRRLCTISIWRNVPLEELSAFTRALALNRSLEGVEIPVLYSRTLDMLSESLRCNETLRDVCVGGYLFGPNEVLGMCSALMANRSVQALEYCNILNIECGQAFGSLLRATTTIRSVTFSGGVLNNVLTCIVRGMTSNVNVWKLSVRCLERRVTHNCRGIAAMLLENTTLNAFFLCGAHVEDAGLRTIASGLSSNQFLQVLFVTYPGSSAAGFYVNECLRRNSNLQRQAVRFVLKEGTDKEPAAAFQLYQRSEFFVHELSKMPDVLTASSAKSLIREAKNYIMLNYFVVTGVVKRCLVCMRSHQGTPITQLDALNAECVYQITRYLKVSDVKC